MAEFKTELIFQIEEVELGCGDRAGPEVLISPDIKFREITSSRTNKAVVNKDSLHFAWYVNTHEDLSHFVVSVQNITTGVKLAEVTLPYTVRYHEFDNITSGSYYVCIEGRDSLDRIRPLQKEQCQTFTAGSGIILKSPTALVVLLVAAATLLLGTSSVFL